jgi:serine/threonine protein phosphatase 1
MMPIVIGDIAGQHKALLALVDKCPKDKEIILVGDLVDRGPRSNRVVEWAIATPNVRAVLGNHEHMLLDFHGRAFEGQKGPIYQRGLWDGYNGGQATLDSYGVEGIPKEHLDWLASLPLFIETDEFFISHSSLLRRLTLEKACSRNVWQDLDEGILWNRDYPTPRDDGKIQIFGHNSQFGLRQFFRPASQQIAPVSTRPFAICLDDSGKKRLTALDTDTWEIIQQDYIK